MSFIKEKIVWPLRYKRAVKSADKRAHYTGANQYVILCGGKLLTMSKRDITIAVANHNFRRGVSVAQIRKMAIYTATPNH